VAEREAAQGAIAVAITGASGIAYGLRLVECLLRAEQSVYLMLSEAGRVVVGMEAGLSLPRSGRGVAERLRERLDVPTGQLAVFGAEQWTAPVASGSGAPTRMAICPCTMGTLAAVAHGLSNNLIERSADVMLKEGHRLILVPRETPFSVIHLENMLGLARQGAVVLPANPGFYHEPDSVEAIVDFIVARVLDQLGIPQDLMNPWGRVPEEASRGSSSADP